MFRSYLRLFIRGLGFYHLSEIMHMDLYLKEGNYAQVSHLHQHDVRHVTGKCSRKERRFLTVMTEFHYKLPVLISRA